MNDSQSTRAPRVRRKQKPIPRANPDASSAGNTRPEAARILGVHVTTVDRLIKAGVLASVRVGHRVYVPHSAIPRYLASTATGPADQHDLPAAGVGT